MSEGRDLQGYRGLAVLKLEFAESGGLVFDLRETKAQQVVYELGRRMAQRRISERIDDVRIDDEGAAWRSV
ncbi:unnamed protein product [Symbiodinium pilosum]|uniref:Uncharacterized protein n=1 Tax=Symbiodinium pilosum TaxID=2952 RepID=A0A812RCL0_SYMPI|nr:unnamed protein product [Symbiodinium pilosum]